MLDLVFALEKIQKELFFFLAVIRLEPMDVCMLDKYSVTELSYIYFQALAKFGFHS